MDDAFTEANVNKNTISHKIKHNKFNLNVKISKMKRADNQLLEQYNVKRYLNPEKFQFAEEIEELIPQDTPLYFDDGENYVERISRALSYFKQCALIGPSGTGKTHIVYLVAQIAGLPLWEINCGLQTSVYDLFGRYIGLGKENWIDGIITSWCRYGGILYLDEANMMKQDIATKLNPILDARGHMVLTEKDNEIIPRHKNSFMIISMNPFSVEFAGTKPLNAAFRRRMSVWINFDYLSVNDKISEKEVNLIANKTGLSQGYSKKIVEVAAKLRYEYKTGDLPYGPSVEDIKNWSKLIADGSTAMHAAEETIIAMTSDDLEVQDYVRKVIKQTDWSTNEVIGAPKDLIAGAIEKTLLDIGKPDLVKVKQQLLQDYSCTLVDCYEKPELLNRVIKEIYGNSYMVIVDSIKQNLHMASNDNSVNTFLEIIAR